MKTNDTSGAPIELAEGVCVDEIIAVESSEHLAEVLRTATDQRDVVIPYGGRRSLVTGNLTRPARWGIDLTGLRGIVVYEPADLTLSVQAGTTMSEIQGVLREAGQELPIDVPFPDVTTIGGLVATGFAGPRRLRSGSLRDLLIGCEFVRGDGLLAKAGGLVVKNVSGFEIPRFLHGSWGALAVLTSVNLKVTPLARAEGTLVSAFDHFGDAMSKAQERIAAEASVEACVVVIDGDEVKVAARAVGRAGAVSSMLDSFGQGFEADAERLDADSSRVYWQKLVEAFAEDSSRVVISMSTRPRDVQDLTRRVNEVGLHCGARILVSPGIGSIRISIPVDHDQAFCRAAEVLDLATSLGVPRMLESAPQRLREAVATWGREPDGLELMRSVKRQFDPSDVLNRGRLFL